MEKQKREKRTEEEMLASMTTPLQRVMYIAARVKKIRAREAELLAQLTEDERELLEKYN